MTTTGKQRTTLFFDQLLIKQARVQAIIEDSSLTFLVEKALIKYLPKVTIIKNSVIKGGGQT